MEIPVTIRRRHAVLPEPGIFAVCGSSGDTIRFEFDAEWEVFPEKTAHFVMHAAGADSEADVVFQGNVCAVPVIAHAAQVSVGVSAGSLRTTTAARIPCLPCITDIPAEEAHPQQDVYAVLLCMLMHRQPQAVCSGRYLVTADEDYLATDAGDYLMTKE